jgi:urease accessory protein
MTTFPRRIFSAAALVFAVASPALAHPGHDGGHELTWDLSLPAAHPFVALTGLLVAAVVVWVAWRKVSRRAG